MKKGILKKVLSLVLVVCLVAATTSVFAASQSEKMASMGFVTKEILSNPDRLSVRCDLAYSAAKVSGALDLAPVDTKFSDVKADNVYSGYINDLSQKGILNGVDATRFAPNDLITFQTAAKVFVTVLGYEEAASKAGGYPDGYLYVAQELGLFDDVALTDGGITGESFAKLVYNALITPCAKGEYFVKDGKLNLILETSGREPFVTTQLGYSLYKGEITEVNGKNDMMKFFVSSNKYESNHTLLKEGDFANLSVLKSVDAVNYEGVPATIWVNSDDVVVYIEPQKNYEVKYGTIISVNDDETEGAKYRPNDIYNFTILDDEEDYEVSDNVTILFNGKETLSEKVIVGKYARFVSSPDGVTLIEIYEMSDGGLITEVNDKAKTISYIKGVYGQATLDEIKDAKRLRVYINGKSSTFSDVLTDSVFSYYKDSDNVVIAVSEHTVADTLISVSNKQIEVGNQYYKVDSKTLYSIDGGNTYKNTDGIYQKLLSEDVEAFIGVDGKVKFVRKFDGNISDSAEFYGMLGGYKSDSMNEEKEVIVYTVADSSEKKIYKITDKTKFENGLTESAFLATSNKKDSTSLYKFEAKENGVLKSVKKAKYFSGHGEAKVSAPKFENDSTPYLWVGNKALFFVNSPIYASYTDEDSDFVISRLSWGSLQARSFPKETEIAFYAEDEYADAPELVLVSGYVKNQVSSFASPNYGILIEKSLQINEKEKEVVSLKILTRNGEKKYLLTKEKADKLSENSFVCFYINVDASDDEINIISASPLSKGYEVAGFTRGVVDRITSTRLHLSGEGDNGRLFLHPYFAVIVSVSDAGGRTKYTLSDFSKAEYGDDIYYFNAGGEVRAIFIIE